MKSVRSYVMIAAIAASAFAPFALAAERNVTLDVSAMMCGADPHNIKNALSSLAGVSKVEIFLQQKTAVVTFDDQKSSVDQMLSAMAGAGYASLVKSQN